MDWEKKYCIYKVQTKILDKCKRNKSKRVLRDFISIVDNNQLPVFIPAVLFFFFSFQYIPIISSIPLYNLFILFSSISTPSLPIFYIHTYIILISFILHLMLYYFSHRLNNCFPKKKILLLPLQLMRISCVYGAY